MCVFQTRMTEMYCAGGRGGGRRNDSVMAMRIAIVMLLATSLLAGIAWGAPVPASVVAGPRAVDRRSREGGDQMMDRWLRVRVRRIVKRVRKVKVRRVVRVVRKVVRDAAKPSAPLPAQPKRQVERPPPSTVAVAVAAAPKPPADIVGPQPPPAIAETSLRRSSFSALRGLLHRSAPSAAHDLDEDNNNQSDPAANPASAAAIVLTEPRDSGDHSTLDSSFSRQSDDNDHDDSYLDDCTYRDNVTVREPAPAAANQLRMELSVIVQNNAVSDGLAALTAACLAEGSGTSVGEWGVIGADRFTCVLMQLKWYALVDRRDAARFARAVDGFIRSGNLTLCLRARAREGGGGSGGSEGNGGEDVVFAEDARVFAGRTVAPPANAVSGGVGAAQGATPVWAVGVAIGAVIGAATIAGLVIASQQRDGDDGGASADIGQRHPTTSARDNVGNADADADDVEHDYDHDERGDDIDADGNSSRLARELREIAGFDQLPSVTVVSPHAIRPGAV